MRLAYFGVPHLGGTFSVYRQLRSGLAPQVQLLWLGVDADGAAALDAPEWAAERPYGIVVRTPSGSAPKAARAVLQAIETERLDGIIINVLADPLQTNLARYLPRRLLRLMIVHNITVGTYAAAAAIRDYVHATVAVAPRIRTDLIDRYGFSPDWTFAIANGTDAAPDRAPLNTRRLLYLGRIEEQAKGVLMLPRIMHHLPASVRLTIAGDGPDFARLRRACMPLGERVVFRGAVRPEDVSCLFAEHDVLVMPSRFEGCPLVLLEAMANGCVPVASLLRGVTDAIISHGCDGRLFPVGNATAAAKEIADLLGDPAALAAHAALAQATMRFRFDTAAMASGYCQVLKRVSTGARTVAPSLSPDQWSLPPGLRPGLRSYLPTPIKNALRTIRERLATETGGFSPVFGSPDASDKAEFS